MVTTPELAPPSVTEEMCSGAVPELVSITACGPAEAPCVVAANETAFGVRLTAGWPAGAAWPVPARGTDCGEPGASSAMTTLAARWPAPSGENTTLREQELAGGKGTVQLLEVKVKSPGLAPLSNTEEICSVAGPALVSVMVCGGLVLPCAVVANVRVPGSSVTAGAGEAPVPVSGMSCGLPGALSVDAKAA